MAETLVYYIVLAEGQTYDDVKQTFPSGFPKTRKYRYDSNIVLVLLDPDPTLAPQTELRTQITTLVSQAYDETAAMLDGVDRVYEIMQQVSTKASIFLDSLTISQETKDFLQNKMQGLVTDEIVAQGIVAPVPGP